MLQVFLWGKVELGWNPPLLAFSEYKLIPLTLQSHNSFKIDEWDPQIDSAENNTFYNDIYKHTTNCPVF